MIQNKQLRFCFVSAPAACALESQLGMGKSRTASFRAFTPPIMELISPCCLPQIGGENTSEDSRSLPSDGFVSFLGCV